MYFSSLSLSRIEPNDKFKFYHFRNIFSARDLSITRIYPRSPPVERDLARNRLSNLRVTARIGVAEFYTKNSRVNKTRFYSLFV